MRKKRAGLAPSFPNPEQEDTRMQTVPGAVRLR